uniref:Uncharacterized protein n=1 Tax=Balaenoptera musculus TaxID=9771 RepID=A0A8C0I6B9_BALMU
MTRGTSASSLLFREQSFLCAAGETREQSWAQVLKSPCGEWALRCFWVRAEQAYTDGGASVPARTSSPYPSLSHQCVKCNDPLKSKPIPPNASSGLIQALPPSPSVQVAWITSSA